MCGSMVDIQSATSENRRGKERKKKKPHEEKYNGLYLPYSTRRPQRGHMTMM